MEEYKIGDIRIIELSFAGYFQLLGLFCDCGLNFNVAT